ncbi:hypothetical protein P9X10_02840 [Bacillus cereus]|nr:hypothetical protein [Bacillus cereus]
MAKITEDVLRDLYEEQDKSDREIAIMFGMTKSNVTYYRRKWGISGKATISDKALEDVCKELKSLGLTVENKKKSNSSSLYDILVNDKVKLEVRSTETLKEDTFRFKLLDKESSSFEESEVRLQLKNGRTKKNLRNTCDFIILVGYIKSVPHFWVIPSKDLKDTLYSVSIRPYSDSSKYNIYKDSWHIIS